MEEEKREARMVSVLSRALLDTHVFIIIVLVKINKFKIYF